MADDKKITLSDLGLAEDISPADKVANKKAAEEKILKQFRTKDNKTIDVVESNIDPSKSKPEYEKKSHIPRPTQSPTISSQNARINNSKIASERQQLARKQSTQNMDDNNGYHSISINQFAKKPISKPKDPRRETMDGLYDLTDKGIDRTKRELTAAGGRIDEAKHKYIEHNYAVLSHKAKDNISLQRHIKAVNDIIDSDSRFDGITDYERKAYILYKVAKDQEAGIDESYFGITSVEKNGPPRGSSADNIKIINKMTGKDNKDDDGYLMKDDKFILSDDNNYSGIPYKEDNDNDNIPVNDNSNTLTTTTRSSKPVKKKQIQEDNIIDDISNNDHLEMVDLDEIIKKEEDIMADTINTKTDTNNDEIQKDTKQEETPTTETTKEESNKNDDVVVIDTSEEIEPDTEDDTPVEAITVHASTDNDKKDDTEDNKKDNAPVTSKDILKSAEDSSKKDSANSSKTVMGIAIKATSSNNNDTNNKEEDKKSSLMTLAEDPDDINSDTDNTNATPGLQPLSDEERDERRKEFNDQIKQIFNIDDKHAFDGFSISNEAIGLNTALESTRNMRTPTIVWGLQFSGTPFEMTPFSGEELIQFSSDNTNYRSITGLRTIFSIIYKHLIIPNKPSFEVWLKQVSDYDVEALFFGVYMACFKDNNYITYECPNNTCGKIYVEKKDVRDMVLYPNDQVKARFQNILKKDTVSTKLYRTRPVPISDKYAVGFVTQSIWSNLFEPTSLSEDFRTKYATVVNLMPTIDRVYLIDKANKQLKPISFGTVANDLTKTVIRKAKGLNTIFRTFTMDERTKVYLKAMEIANSFQEEAIHYQYPGSVCPACGREIKPRQETPLTMIFTRSLAPMTASASTR